MLPKRVGLPKASPSHSSRSSCVGIRGAFGGNIGRRRQRRRFGGYGRHRAQPGDCAVDRFDAAGNLVGERGCRTVTGVVEDQYLRLVHAWLLRIAAQPRVRPRF
jgi:hypothetical protein